ncbi:hypothetical protein L6452_37959 [Arctium lappa]|uniref:Uncharacterized protein n=1 Tax=Arctium lappa TaxID=4217 RepID=A0ACB8Y5X5_ARCLA|nr:hypothetical protein L6452_37959 [Arctium lappa]
MVGREKALDSFLKGTARGSTLAMVDVGLVYWEMGKKEAGVALYRKAVELGDPAGQCNLGISYLQVEPSNMKKAVKWLYQASVVAGYVPGQYQLALCLHRGGGMNQNLSDAARWYLRAAEGGYVHAMYNVSLCYSLGMGVSQNHRQSRKWMKHAADHGHRNAQFEHGLALFSEGQMMKAVVYLELAGRGGETAATHLILLPICLKEGVEEFLQIDKKEERFSLRVEYFTMVVGYCPMMLSWICIKLGAKPILRIQMHAIRPYVLQLMICLRLQKIEFLSGDPHT